MATARQAQQLVGSSLRQDIKSECARDGLNIFIVLPRKLEQLARRHKIVQSWSTESQQLYQVPMGEIGIHVVQDMEIQLSQIELVDATLEILDELNNLYDRFANCSALERLFPDSAVVPEPDQAISEELISIWFSMEEEYSLITSCASWETPTHSPRIECGPFQSDDQNIAKGPHGLEVKLDSCLGAVWETATSISKLLHSMQLLVVTLVGRPRVERSKKEICEALRDHGLPSH